MACRHCGREGMDAAFMARLEALRAELGRPLPVTSGYRCPEHDRAIGGAGVHPQGHAADLAVAGADAVRLVRAALELGFTGIGLHQKGPLAARFVHLDDLSGGPHPRPRLWTY